MQLEDIIHEYENSKKGSVGRKDWEDNFLPASALQPDGRQGHNAAQRPGEETVSVIIISSSFFYK